MIYQSRVAGERAIKKRRPPAKIANRLRPLLVRRHRLDVARSAELRAAGVLE
jgi:hypothetical protein